MNIMNNKRGAPHDVIIFLIIAFVIITFFGAWLFANQILTNNLEGVDLVVGDNTNFSDIVKDTFSEYNDGLQTIKTLAWVLMISMILTTFVANFFIKGNPIFIFVYVAFSVVGVILAVFISNSYELLLGNGLLGLTYQSFTGANFIMLNLPWFAAVIGIIGAMFLFINPRDPIGGLSSDVL